MDLENKPNMTKNSDWWWIYGGRIGGIWQRWWDMAAVVVYGSGSGIWIRIGGGIWIRIGGGIWIRIQSGGG